MTNPASPPAPALVAPSVKLAALSPPYPKGNYASPDMGEFTLNGPRMFLADGSLLARPPGPIPGIVAKEHADFSAFTPEQRQAVREKARSAADGRTAAQRIEANAALRKLQDSARRKLTPEEQKACGLA